MTPLKWWRGLTAHEKWVWVYLLVAGSWSVYNLVEVCVGARWIILIAPFTILIGAILLFVDLCKRKRRNQE